MCKALWTVFNVFHRKKGAENVNRELTDFSQRKCGKRPSVFGVDIGGDIPDGAGHVGAGLHHVLDLPYGGEYGGMVSVFKLMAYVCKGHVCQRPAQVHGHLTGGGCVFLAALAPDRLFGEAVVAGGLGNDDIRGGDIGADLENVLGDPLRYVDVGGGWGYRGIRSGSSTARWCRMSSHRSPQ